MLLIHTHYIFKLLTDEEMFSESNNAVYCLHKINFPLKRNESHLIKKLNEYGRQFLDFCVANGIFILDCKIEGDKTFLSFTCTGCNTIDYFACSTGLSQFPKYMNVKVISSFISDVKWPIEICLDLGGKIKSEDLHKENVSYNTENLWNSKKKKRTFLQKTLQMKKTLKK